jgi:SAM-dependent methyltransferase
MLAECAESIRRLASGVRPTLLEVGIGYGEVALSAVKAFPWFEVFGLEHPDRAFLSNSGYLAKMKNGGIKLVTSDMSNGKLPFDDSTFDVVLFCEVLEHVSPVEVPRIVAELSRILKAGGALVIASPNLTSLFNRAVFVSGGNIFTPAIPLDYAGRTYGHIRLYTTGELKGLASLAGLNVKCVRYNNSMLMSGTEKRWHTIVVKRLQAVLSALFPSLSANWTVVLSK